MFWSPNRSQVPAEIFLLAFLRRSSSLPRRLRVTKIAAATTETTICLYRSSAMLIRCGYCVIWTKFPPKPVASNIVTISCCTCGISYCTRTLLVVYSGLSCYTCVKLVFTSYQHRSKVVLYSC